MGQKAKPSTPTQAIDAFIGDEEQNRKQKKEEKERNRERDPNPATLDHSVTSTTMGGGDSVLVLKGNKTQDKG